MVVRTRIKICGITRVQDAELVAASGADAMGMIFYPKSPRYIELGQAREVCKVVQPYVTTVAVVVNPELDFLNQIEKQGLIDRIQFHGDETHQQCEQTNLPYYKVLRVNSGLDIELLASRYPGASSLLLDTYSEGLLGGSGQVFDWSIIKGSQIDQHLVLAGGLSPENIFNAVMTVKPYAVDVNSGVEIKPGIKDAVKLNEIIIAVREADKKLMLDHK